MKLMLQTFCLLDHRQLWLLGLTCAIIEFPILAGFSWIAGQGGVLFKSKAQLVWRERRSGGALLVVGAAIAGMARGS